MAGLAE